MTAMLTTPYRAKHPDVRFSIVSKTSIEVLRLLEDLEVDAGLTYLDNEPIGRVKKFLRSWLAASFSVMIHPRGPRITADSILPCPYRC